MDSDRRLIMAGALAASAAAVLPVAGFAQSAQSDTRPVPSTGERIPVVGLGTWVTFNVGTDPDLVDRSVDVTRAFVAEGGGMIDSSPMYGSAQDVIGTALTRLDRPANIFSADKVWTDADDGPGQMAQTARRWGVQRFDLMQVHNLVDWERNLDTLFAMKADGRVRYVGITTSHGRRHGDMARIMERYPLDFVQLTYNVLDRAVQDRLLPLAQDRGIGVIVNRPFQRKALIRRTAGAPLPGYAADLQAPSWASLMLKFILAHPAVTTVIPATTQVAHVRQNKQSARTALPDAELRERIARDVRDL
ncbi:aldo/keto reductase [Minwuia sp.]|uniref:aldo/keto reductase n=1 Tax=Minwuia sp. TaxID=2493630 RepID=UPI003A9136B0